MKINKIIFTIFIGSLFLSACGSVPYANAKAEIKTGIQTAQETVEQFYNWYIDYSGTPENSNFRSPLSDKAYQNSPYLSPSFINSIDEFMTLPPEKANYDPILCAQNIPGEIFVETMFYTEDKSRALVGDDFVGHHRFTVELINNADQWQIDNVICSISADGAAAAFYTWYLGSIGSPASGDFHNLLADGSYQDSALLSETYINEVDQLLSSFKDGGYDPFLLAQDLPRDFEVESGPDSESAIVHLYYGSQTIHDVLVRFVNEKGWMQITAIEALDEPTSEAGNSSKTQSASAAGWLGYISSLPEDDAYDDKLVLLPEGSGELGIRGATDEIENEIIALRDKEAPGKDAHFWGTVECGISDFNNCQMVVDRLRYGATASAAEPVDGWAGMLSSSTFNGSTSMIFTLDSLYPIAYSIHSNDPIIRQELKTMAGGQVRIRVWGDLLTGIPDVNGSRIQAVKIEVLDDTSEAQPVTPQTGPDLRANWRTYNNPLVGYQIQYPENASISEHPIISFPQDELPEGMNNEDYMEQLDERYGPYLCVTLEYGLGYISISAPENKGNHYIICGRSGTAAGDTKGISETIQIGDETFTAKGILVKANSDALDQSGETLWVELDNGTVIEYGSRSVSEATLTDYEMKGAEMICDIIETFRLDE